MRRRLHLSSRGVLVCAVSSRRLAGSAAAQTGRVGGDGQGRSRPADQGRDHHRRESERVSEQLHRHDRRQGPLLDHRPARPARGRSRRRRRASRPSPGKMNVSTIGAPNPPLDLHAEEGRGAGRGALAGVNAKDLQADLAARRCSSTTRRTGTSAIAAYQAILAKAPSLSVDQPADRRVRTGTRRSTTTRSRRTTKLLKVDPNNDKAIDRHRHDQPREGRPRGRRSRRCPTAAESIERERARCSTTSAR